MTAKKHLIMFSTALVLIIIILGLIFSGALFQSEARFPMTAAIIDQLAESFPDLSFVSNVTGTLQNAGFNVTYYNQNLNVEFFRNIGNSNYGLIILRAHAALRNDSQTVDLFTSERYYSSSEKYGSELDSGILSVGEFLYKPGEQYYALSSLFIDNLAGRFPSSIVIAMGCQSLKKGCEQMAQAFVNKGAKAYIGWTDIVFPNDTDQETMNLLSTLISENATIVDAVGSTKPHVYRGPVSPDNDTIVEVESKMSFYPISNADLTIPQLLAQSKASSASIDLNGLAPLFSCVILNKPKRERFERLCKNTWLDN